MRVKGRWCTKGYTDPALDAEAFDDDGLFRTGDLGHLRHDGHVMLTGRLKDIIIRKGENISAKEIEDLLYTHPKVGDVAVIGLPDRSGANGSAPWSRRPRPARPRASTRWSRYLGEAGSDEVKTPEQLVVVDALPRNETLARSSSTSSATPTPRFPGPDGRHRSRRALPARESGPTRAAPVSERRPRFWCRPSL